ncbi:thermonuclease family protein [Agilicoccus flavus]|uniref:thermonuclease family protein n=1 Tax=Agilicoccus flavus TaxID=2775968 RepID=UPI001CF64173|nr:thermonuclease family protein [Agilicoccus flavus]
MKRAIRTGAVLAFLPALAGAPPVTDAASAATRPAASASVAAAAPTTVSAAALTPVTRVVDGDTLHVRVGRRTEKVRVIGLDTPEIGECHAREATRAMAALVQRRSVRLVADHTQPNRDRYQRLLRHVVLRDGRSVAPLLIAGGHGWEFTYGQAYQGQAAHRRAEARAIKARAGLWRGCRGLTRVIAVRGRCAIKGNISTRGEKIYHVPGATYYGATVINPRKGERYFCTELQARKAGWRASEV